MIRFLIKYNTDGRFSKVYLTLPDQYNIAFPD